MQATARSFAIGASGRRGETAAASAASAQRGAKAQPCGMRRGIGHRAGNGGETAARRRRGAAARRSGPAYRDARDRRTAGRSGACSTMRPAYITATRSQISATTPRSWLISTIAMPISRAQAAQQLQNLRLDGGVERGGRLVRDQQIGISGERHRDHDALDLAAGEFVRIGRPAAGLRRGCRPGRAAAALRPSRPSPGDAAMQRQAPRRAACGCAAPG